MPFKSLKQEKFVNAAAKRGEIKKPVAEEMNKASKGKKLPEKAKSKKGM